MNSLDKAIAARTTLADEILALCRDIGRTQDRCRVAILLGQLYALVAKYEAADLAVTNELIP